MKKLFVVAAMTLVAMNATAHKTSECMDAIDDDVKLEFDASAKNMTELKTVAEKTGGKLSTRAVMKAWQRYGRAALALIRELEDNCLNKD